MGNLRPGPADWGRPYRGEKGVLREFRLGEIFDLVVDTGVVSPDEAATLIGESLHDKMLSPFKGTKDKDTFKHTTDNGSST